MHLNVAFLIIPPRSELKISPNKTNLLFVMRCSNTIMSFSILILIPDLCVSANTKYQSDTSIFCEVVYTAGK